MSPALTTSFTRWPWWRRWFGQRSERAAAAYLRRQGARILARNLHTRGGEIDLLARQRHTLLVVEVRSTESRDVERTVQSIDQAKQRTLTQAALAFLAGAGLLEDVSVRFDVLILSWPPDQTKPTIHYYPDAFSAVGPAYQMFA